MCDSQYSSGCGGPQNTQACLDALRRIRLLILDVDGVMTDGRIIMNDQGQETKCFDVRDGHGIKMVMRYGIEVAILTGRESEVVRHRARDLGIAEVRQKCRDKGAAYEEMLARRSFRHEEAAFIGDDIIDIPVLRSVGFAAAVANAAEEAKAVAHYVTTRPGGRGAVREVCDMILKAQGHWADIVERYRIKVAT